MWQLRHEPSRIRANTWGNRNEIKNTLWWWEERINSINELVQRPIWVLKLHYDARDYVWDFFKPWRNSPCGPRPPHFQGFMITLRHTTLGRTPLDEWSARCRDLYLITHNIHRRQTFMPPEGFETTILASERPLGSACAKFRYCQTLITASL